VVSLPLSSASFLTRDFAFSLAAASCSGVKLSSSEAICSSIFEVFGFAGIFFEVVTLY